MNLPMMVWLCWWERVVKGVEFGCCPMPKGSSDSLKRKLIKNFKEIKSSKNLQTTQKEKQPKKTNRKQWKTQ